MFRYYVFDKNKYKYKDCEEWVEIRRIDGKDINYEDDLEIEEFNEHYYNDLLHWNRKDIAIKYKNSCCSKVHLIMSSNHQIIDSDEIKNYSNSDVFIVIDDD